MTAPQVGEWNAQIAALRTELLEAMDAMPDPTPVGTVVSFAGATPPDGYLLCAGQAVSRTVFAALFTAIGTTYGVGDGATTFALPDLRGRVVAGKDNMGGSAASRLTSISNNLGSAGGAETHTLTAAQIPAHSHPVSDPGHAHTQDCSVRLPSSGNNFNTPFSGGGTNALPTNSSTTGITVGNNTGGGGAHNNVQPTFVLNWMIRY